MTTNKIKIAVIGFPAIGGGYTNYCFLKNNLRNFEFKLISLGALSEKGEVFSEPSFVHIADHLDRIKDAKELAFALRDYLHEKEFDVLIPMNSPHAISIIPHLSSRIKVVHRVNGDSSRVYSYVTSHLDHTSAIICNSVKQLEEVKKIVRENSITDLYLIPHGVLISENLGKKKEDGKIRLGYLGRMYHPHKNIFIIPEILKQLEFEFEFEIIGSGEDKKEFLRKLDTEGIPYRDLGTIPNKDLNDYLSHWDILLFPSFEEGFGYTLLEGMNNGAIPIANRLKGVTDYIITNNSDGFIIENNDVQDYVKKISLLYKNPSMLKEMKINAKSTIRDKFNSSLILKSYDQVFSKVVTEDIRKREIIELSKWIPYREYKPPFHQRALSILKSIFSLLK